MSRSSVFRWHKKFQEGKADLKDAPRPGKPKSAATKANVAAVADLIKYDTRLSVKK